MNTYTRQVDAQLMESKFTADVEIRGSYQVAVSFDWCSRSYRFMITRWSANGFNGFISRFHQHCPRDPKVFGTCSVEQGLQASTEQKLLCVYQATADVFRTIDLIASKHRRSLLEYAIWFKHAARVDMGTYRDYITTLACDAIIECNLMAPNVNYEDVRFQ